MVFIGIIHWHIRLSSANPIRDKPCRLISSHDDYRQSPPTVCVVLDSSGI